jgi:hypothetical protein
MNNSSIRTADANTHVKVVLLAVLASVAVAVIGLGIRSTAETSARVQTPVKVGPAMIAEDNQSSTVR